RSVRTERGSARPVQDPGARRAVGFDSATGRRRIEPAELRGTQRYQASRIGEEALRFLRSENALCQTVELPLVIRSFPGTAPVGVRVRNRELRLDRAPIRERDGYVPAERSPGGIGISVARRPCGIFDGADLSPERDRRGAMGALRRIAPLVVPRPVFERHRENVGDRMVEGLATGAGVVFLRIVG